MKTELHCWELPNKAMFWLKTDFWRRLYDLKRMEKLSWKEIARKIGINSGNLQNYTSQLTGKKAQYVPLQTLLKISGFLKIPYFETEKFIVEAKYGRNGKPIQLSFPINFLTQEWASLVGAILAEGNMHQNFGVGFWNKDEEILNNFTELAGKITPDGVRKEESIYGCFLPAIFGQILITGLGFKVGDKTRKNVGIPEIYLNSEDNQIVRSLLSWLFTGDGWVTMFRDHLNQIHRAVGIGFGSPKKDKQPQLLIDTIKLLKNFDIRPSRPYQEIKKQKSGKITYNWRIFIKGKENLDKFYRQISFQNLEKQKILENALLSYEKPKRGDGESLNLLIKAITELHASKKIINKNALAEETKLNSHWVQRLLKRAKDMKIVEVIGGGERTKGRWGGRNPYVYKLLKMVIS